jgi:hypothetical protein
MSDSQAPRITEVKVMMAQREEGELTTWDLAVPYYQLLRNEGAPASAWLIDLGGRVPCDRLALNIAEPSFSRPFQVEAVDDPQNARLIATGELSRRLGEEPKSLVIRFDDEQYVRRLRLIITDHSNQPVSINSIQASAPARQLVFELKQEPSLPLRMAFGNPRITEPHYDFEKELAAKLATVPTRVAVGAVVTNAFYEPEPLPLTERVPWLIYLVLAASSIALGLILFSLARTAMQKLPSQAEESARENSTV